MKLIVGLGNPGRNYQGTRHNVGFDVVDEILRKSGRGGDRTKFEGRLADAELGGERVTLLWPQTFMNLSGTSVGKVRDFYKIETPDILVICDDFNLPLALGTNWLKFAVLLLGLFLVRVVPLTLFRPQGQSLRQALVVSLSLSAPLTLLVLFANLGLRMGEIDEGMHASIIMLAMVSSVVFPLAMKKAADTSR